MGTRRNDDERRLWVLNDEGLYNWHRSARTATNRRQSLREFVRSNRDTIDVHIDQALNRKPAK